MAKKKKLPDFSKMRLADTNIPVVNKGRTVGYLKFSRKKKK